MYRFRFPRITKPSNDTATARELGRAVQELNILNNDLEILQERCEYHAGRAKYFADKWMELKEEKGMRMSDIDLPYASVNDQSIPTDQSLLIAFDPGPHTGWVITNLDHSFFLFGETDTPSMVPHSLHGLLERMTAFHRSATTIIIESFTLTSKPKDPKYATITLHQIGALKHVASRFGIDPVMHLANVRKMTPTKTLQRAGLWPTGLGHAQSAARHLGAYLIKQGTLKP